MNDDSPLTPEQQQSYWDELEARDNGQQPEPKAEEPAADAQQQDPAPEAGSPSASAPADPYAGWPEAAKNAIVAMQGTMAQVQDRLRRAEGHVGGLTSQLKQMSTARAQVQADGGDAPTAKQIADAQGSTEKLGKLLDDYPEFGAAMKDVLEEQARSLRAELESVRAQAAPADAVTREEFEAQQRVMAVESRHPGWQERIKTDDFRQWLAAQPLEVHVLAESEDPRAAIRVLDLHAAAKPSAQDPRAVARVSAAAVPNGRSAPAARVKGVEAMTDKEYWDYLEAQDRAAQRNR